MTVYMLFTRDGAIRDQSAMAAYQRLNAENPPDPNLAPLVVYGAIEALEGDAPQGMVMLRFLTTDDARAWYESPGYQAALPHRKKSGGLPRVHRAGFVTHSLLTRNGRAPGRGRRSGAADRARPSAARPSPCRQMP
jgi:uncharacterized protein (DUF1330 family)